MQLRIPLQVNYAQLNCANYFDVLAMVWLLMAGPMDLLLTSYSHANLNTHSEGLCGPNNASIALERADYIIP